MYRAEYFVNGEKVSLTFLKGERYHPIIFKHFKVLFELLKMDLYLPGSFASASFKYGNGCELFTIIVYFQKGKCYILE